VALDADTYPRQRTSRAGPTPSSLTPLAEGAVATPPRTRTFTFRLDMNAAKRSTVSAGPLKGPAIVRGIHAIQSGAAGQVHVLELGKSSSAVLETDVAIALAKPWTSLMERLSSTVAAESALRVGTLELDAGAPGGIRDDSLGIIILDVEFFLVISWQSLATSGASLSGHVTVLEQVPTETIASFQ